jgi:hypothetical protein
MRSIRKAALPVFLAVLALSGVATPAAEALIVPPPGGGTTGGATGPVASPCGSVFGAAGAINAGAPVTLCPGGGDASVGPPVGEISTVYGPTIVNASLVGSPTVASAGPVVWNGP